MPGGPRHKKATSGRLEEPVSWLAMAPHVLLVSLPVYGHIHPLLQLAVQLARLGTKVTFVSSSTTKGKSLSTLDSILSLTFGTQDESLAAACKLNIQFGWLPVDDEWKSKLLDSKSTEILWNAIFYMGGRAAEIEHLARTSEQGKPVRVILDMLVVRALADQLRSRLNTPTVFFWTASSAFIVAHCHLKTLVEDRYMPLQTADGRPNQRRLMVGTLVLPGLPELSVEEDVPYSFHDEDPRDPGLKHLSTFKDVLPESPILVNSFQELEKDALQALATEGVQVVPVGPLLPPNPAAVHQPTAIHDGILGWLSLHAQCSVVYISFGTLANMSASQIHQLASGLEQAAYPFLWVLREEHSSLLPEGFMDGFLDRTKDLGLVVNWSPQVQVLRHPAVGAFLTHAGWNSLLESMTSGVPVLCWPFLADQNLNSKYVADVWKTGKRLGGRHSDLSGSYIAASIKSLMEDDETRNNTRRWMEAGRAALGENGTSFQNLKDVVNAF